MEAADGPVGEQEVVLTGGSVNTVVRRGDTVHRSAGAWTPTVHRLLRHLHARGIGWVPRPLGTDEQGREVLSYLPGTVPSYPLPRWVWDEQVLVDAGHALAQVHAASADFDLTAAVWQLPAHEPAEVVCLGDVAPYNMVFGADHRLSGLIDLDTASPGPRAWDLAYLAYRLVPLTAASDTGAADLDMATLSRRLAVLCRAYADAGDRVAVPEREVVQVAVRRLEDLADFTARRAAAGAESVAHHVQIYRTDAAWLREHAEELISS